jgi:hypothetical protein
MRLKTRRDRVDCDLVHHACSGYRADSGIVSVACFTTDDPSIVIPRIAVYKGMRRAMWSFFDDSAKRMVEEEHPIAPGLVVFCVLFITLAFELRNMVCHIFWPKARRSKAPHGKSLQSKSAKRGRGFKWRAPTRSVWEGPFKPQTGLLPEGRPWVRSGFWRSQTRRRSDFKRTWVRLGERGRRGRFGPRRGESLFSREIICRGNCYSQRAQRARSALPGPGTATVLLPGAAADIPTYTVKVQSPNLKVHP